MQYAKSDSLTNMYFEDDIVNTTPNYCIPVESMALRNFITLVPTPPTNKNLRQDNHLHVRDAEVVYTVSDRSMDPVSRHAAFHWILMVEERLGTISCSNPLHANPKYMTSF